MGLRRPSLCKLPSLLAQAPRDGEWKYCCGITCWRFPQPPGPCPPCCAGASQRRLDELAALLNQQLRRLPDFRRKTLQASWFWILPPDPKPEPAAPAEQQQQQQQAQPAQQAQQAQQQQGEGASGGQEGLRAAEAQAAAAGEEAEQEAARAAERAAVLAAAGERAAFVAAERFCGAVPGLCFKLGDAGLGYYIDRPPPTAQLLEAEQVRLGGLS